MKWKEKVKSVFRWTGLLLIAVQISSCEKSTGNEGDPDPDDDGSTEGIEIKVGSKTFTTNKYTAAGTPVVPMWDLPLFNPLITDGTGGFELLDNAEHASVWQPQSLAEGAYNHYACLAYHKGRFYAMWGNHQYGEDGPGQKVMWASSDEWGSWTDAEELFPSPGPMLPRDDNGIHLKPDRWAVIDDELYAITYVVGAGTGYPIARQVYENGEIGEPFLVTELPNNSGLPEYMDEEDHSGPPPVIGGRLRDWYDETDQVSWWAGGEWGVRRTGVDGQTLIECFMYRAKDDNLVVMLRDWGHWNNPVHNNRIYVSFRSDDGGVWSAPYPSDIPDSPSRGEAVTLDDGTVLLIGNQIVNVFDRAEYLNRTPITVAISQDGYVFDRVYSLRANAPTTWRLAGGIGGRNPGFAYSSSLVHEGWLYTLYSIGKEDMGITRVRLSDLGL